MEDLGMLNEQELIQKAKKGDEDCFETLILSCKTKAYNIAFRYMGNEEDALDVLQESFIKIYRHLDKFNEHSRFDTWVYRIVVNTSNDLLRKNKKNQHEEILVEVADHEPGLEEMYIQNEESCYILHCLNQLPDDQKEMLILRDINGFAYDEIAEMLNCSMGTVKSRISRARQKLKEIYLQAV